MVLNIYPKETEQIKEIAIKMNIPTLLVGEAGLGKSTTAIFAIDDLPYSTVNLSRQHDLVDLLGQYVLEKDPEGEGTRFAWKDGKVTKAVKEGHVLVLEELTMADASVLSALHGLIEQPPKLHTLQGDVEVHENFRIIGTCNPSWTNYQGVTDLNYAFQDRFAHIEFPFPSRDKVYKFLKPYQDNYKKRGVDRDDMYDLAKKLFDLYPDKLNHYMSLRGLKVFSMLLESMGEKEALQIAMLNRVDPDEREEVLDIVDNFIAIY